MEHHSKGREWTYKIFDIATETNVVSICEGQVEWLLEEEEEIPTREPGVWKVGDTFRIWHKPSSEVEKDWGLAEILEVSPEGKIGESLLIKKGESPWAENQPLNFDYHGSEYDYRLELIEGVDE